METAFEKAKLLRRRNTKRITITVKASGKVVVTAPKWTPVYVIKNFVNSRQKWIEEQLAKFENKPGSILLKGSREEYLNHKEEARKLVSQKINEYNKYYNFKIGQIRIKNQSTLWGSCSAKGNLNFNYRIVFLPSHLQDYIVVHEMCHLKELNHSSNFWKLVEKTVPDYKNYRKTLKNLC